MTSRTDEKGHRPAKAVMFAGLYLEVVATVAAVVAATATANPLAVAIAGVVGLRLCVSLFSIKHKLGGWQLQSGFRQARLVDDLTGLYNVEGLRRKVDDAIADWSSSGTNATLVAINIQGFKSINDSYGGTSGDALLIELADRLRKTTRGDDVVARMHGDEFAVLLHDVQAPGDGADVAIGRLREVLSVPVDLGQRGMIVRFNIGYGGTDESVTSGEDLIRNATSALHVGRSLRNNQPVIFHPEMQAQVFNRINLQADLENAISNNELQLYFQPTVNIYTGRLDGAEALLRWPHPERGYVSPAEFIPLAEESGLIIPIGNWVLRQACAQMRMWQGRYNAPELKVSVNLSARQLEQPDLVDIVKDAMDDSGIAAGSLVLEITESILMNDSADTIEKMEELVELGCEFSIDDFGTGYSGLGYLQKFPVSELKVDRSFVIGLGAGELIDSDQLSLVQAIVDLARTLRLRTVAEGVETVSQLEAVKGLGCDVAQGFLLARPMPAEDVRRLIETTHAEGRPIPIG